MASAFLGYMHILCYSEKKLNLYNWDCMGPFCSDSLFFPQIVNLPLVKSYRKPQETGSVAFKCL